MNYLYNGVELPALPEWDKEKYPYAVITKFLDTFFYLDVYEKTPKNHIPTWNDSDGWIFLLDVDTSGARYVARSTMPDDGWTLSYEFSNVETNKQCTYIVYKDGEVETDWVWSNFDILLPNGDVCFAASDPIPVGGEPIDPTSFLQGYIVGRRLAGMRK